MKNHNEIDRNQFLVNAMGKYVTQKYRCYANYAVLPTSCVMDTKEYHDCVFAKEGFDKIRCKNWKKVPLDFYNFSNPENFIWLLELAEKKRINFEIDTKTKTIILLDNVGYFPQDYRNIFQLPAIIADLIAGALGFKEGE